MALLAHQGGWDEALFVLAPVGIFAFLLWLANRRAAARLAEDEADAEVAVDEIDAADHDRNGIWDEVQHDPDLEPSTEPTGLGEAQGPRNQD